MDVFEKIKLLLVGEKAENKTENEVKQEKDKQETTNDILSRLEKVAMNIEETAPDTKLLKRAVLYLIGENRKLGAELTSIHKRAEAEKLARKIAQRGIISFDEIEAYTTKIAEDLPAWEKAISLLGVNAFAGLDNSPQVTATNGDPLRQILQELG